MEDKSTDFNNASALFDSSVLLFSEIVDESLYIPLRRSSLFFKAVSKAGISTVS